MKILGYVIHVLVLTLVWAGLGMEAISWKIIIPLGILLELIYAGLFYLLMERVEDDGGMK